jgi:hypothetical protein
MHPVIGQRVHSYYVTATGTPLLIDPMVPEIGDEGLQAFAARPPRHAFLTNRHHYRGATRFRQAFGTQIWCHRAGLHEFGPAEQVEGFDHGRTLPGDVEALEVGVLTPEETAYFLPVAGGILAIGDAIARSGEGGDDLMFMPDELLGDDPEGVRHGLCDVFRRHLGRDFDHLLFAHGMPWIRGAKDALHRFLDRGAS